MISDKIFSIQDLITIQHAIELATERGAFKAIELKDVGTAYERLLTFIAVSTRQIESETNESPGEKSD